VGLLVLVLAYDIWSFRWIRYQQVKAGADLILDPVLQDTSGAVFHSGYELAVQARALENPNCFVCNHHLR